MKEPARKKARQQKKEETLKKEKEDGEEKKEGEEGNGGDAEAKPEPMEINASEVDVDSVEDVTDLGDCTPLFIEFAHEDWALLEISIELSLLVHAFRKDLNDPDRPSFREDHLSYYFEKYFGKRFLLKSFNVESLPDLLELIEDSVGLAESSGMLQAKLPEDTTASKFLKLAEEHRRDRARRVDAGDQRR